MCGKTEIDLHTNLVDVVKCSDDTFGDVLKLNVHVKEMHVVSELLDLDEISESTDPLASEEHVRPAIEFFLDKSEHESCEICGKENCKRNIL